MINLCNTRSCGIAIQHSVAVGARSCHLHVIDPLVKHLAMLVEVVILSVYFLLISIFVELTVGTEVVPALVIAHVIAVVYTSKSVCCICLVIIVICKGTWSLQP